MWRRLLYAEMSWDFLRRKQQIWVKEWEKHVNIIIISRVRKWVRETVTWDWCCCCCFCYFVGAVSCEMIYELVHFILVCMCVCMSVFGAWLKYKSTFSHFFNPHHKQQSHNVSHMNERMYANKHKNISQITRLTCSCSIHSIYSSTHSFSFNFFCINNNMNFPFIQFSFIYRQRLNVIW